MLATLRQRRYLGLFAAAFVVALVCVAAGTWQIARFEQKRAANAELRHNNRFSLTPVAQALGPASAGQSVSRADQFRHVTATGSYLAADQTMVRGQTVDGDVGYLVLTPFRTADGVLLVVRGFVAQTEQARATPAVPAPPSGTLTLTTRLEPADTRADHYGALPANQVESINPIEQSGRLGTAVWNGYGELLAGQPGTAGLTVIPDPDMSNPAGGAEEPQHAAYVVQWYLFAGLALALPFVLAAAERRRDATEAPAPKAGSGSPEASADVARGPEQADAADQVQGRRLSRRARRAELDDRLAGRR